MEFAEYVFKTEICLDKSPTDDEKTAKKIAKWISALMNTSGGLILLYSSRPDSDRKRDKWMMGLEFFLTNNSIPESLLQSLVRYRYLETDGQLRIYVFVGQSPSVVIFHFYAFGRRTAGVGPIKDADRVRKMLNESHSSTSGSKCLSQMNELIEGDAFKMDYPIPIQYRESETMEFKHCYSYGRGNSEKTELSCFEATELKHRLGKYLEYLSAFANTHGGSLVLGVDEHGQYPLVRGFPVTQNQEREETSISEYLETRLEKCIWHGDPEYKPVKGQDWDIFYHKVISEDGTERKMIEVRITKHSGGMFLQPPLYYCVDSNGEIEEKKIEWINHLETDTLDVDSEDKQSQLQKHIERGGPEVIGQDVQDKIVPSVPAQDEIISNLPGQDGIIPNVPGAIPACAPVPESKIPKSFKESQSEHKSQILVQGLSIHDCCTKRMVRYIQTCKGENIWYPCIEQTLKKTFRNACSEKVVTFLQAKGWHGVASVIEIAKESNTANGCDLGDHSLIYHVLIINEKEPPTIICCICDHSNCTETKPNMEKLVGYVLDSGAYIEEAVPDEYIKQTVPVNKQYRSTNSTGQQTVPVNKQYRSTNSTGLVCFTLMLRCC